jgi:type IV pilus assembly protein PilM
MTRPLADLVEQIRGSLDYYRAQPGAPRLLRVTLTGGASQTPGLAEQLRELVGLAVEQATPREHFEIGDIGFPPEHLESIDPYLPTPAGLALGGLATGRRINLVGGEGRAALNRQRLLIVAGAVGLLLLVALGGIWWIRKSALDTEKDRLAQAQAKNAQLTQEQASLASAAKTQQEIDTLSGQVTTVLAQDISWARMLQEIARTIPNDTWLTSFQGTSTLATAGATGSTLTPSTPTAGTATTTPTTAGSTTVPGTPTTPAPATASTGTVTFSVTGLDFRSVSAWIQRIGTQIPSFTNLWVPNASRGGETAAASGRDFVTFSSTANITSAARSDRLETFQKKTP